MDIESIVARLREWRDWHGRFAAIKAMNEAADALTALSQRLETVERERDNIETRFWGIVDRDGLTGLPSDMWDALDRLVNRAARTLAAEARLATAVETLEPFASIADQGKRGGAFVIAKAIYADMGGTTGISAPRQSHWHWRDFERARAALTSIKES